MKRDLKEIINDRLILMNSPHPLIPELLYFLMKHMFSIFKQAIKFD